MILPPQAAAMYPTWWQFVQGLAQATNPDGTYELNIAQAQSIASNIYPDFEATAAPYNPIGLSQLFSAARKISNTAVAIDNAPGDSPITPDMVAAAPFGRPAAEQAASPKWWAKGQMTYTTPEGVTETGIFQVQISQTLPYSVDALKTYVSIMAQSQLVDTSPTGTPRHGQLQSIDSIQLLSW